MIKQYLIEMCADTKEMLLCPYTWTGAGAAFFVSLTNSTDTLYAKYILFAMFLFSVANLIWLKLNILNVRGKPI